jgi:hypothetical protein
MLIDRLDALQHLRRSGGVRLKLSKYRRFSRLVTFSLLLLNQISLFLSSPQGFIVGAPGL